MASVYISEFASVAQNSGAGGGAQYGRLPEITTQVLNSWPQSSAAFSSTTQSIRVIADSVCSIVVSPQTPSGNTPAAAVTSLRIAANVPEYFAVTPGHYLSVVANS
jgi:hypothetical protein